MNDANDYNYVRVSQLEPVSIESLALIVALSYFLYLVYKRQANWDIAYFLALPFTDHPFRIGSLQPVEIISILLVAFNYRRIRLNYVVMIGCTFFLFSIIGFLTANVHSAYSPLYSLRFLLIGLVFSVFRNKEFQLPVSTMRFLILFSFTMTFLQAGLWLAGLPIHGVFYNGVLPRTKGLAHEPGTWAIWVVTLFPFILHFKLGRIYLILNFLMLLLTFSTFGTTATLSFFLIRWIMAGAHFRLRKSALRSIGVIVVLMLTIVVVRPDTLASGAKLLTVFDKLLIYQQELSLFSQGKSTQAADEENGESGRGSDLAYFKENFPDHWLVGVGSFNAPYDVAGQQTISGTNTYLILPVEIGIVGSGIVCVLLFLHYQILLRTRRGKSIDFIAYSLNFLLMVMGIRCFGFYEPWYAQVATLRLAHQSPDPELPASDWSAEGLAAMKSA